MTNGPDSGYPGRGRSLSWAGMRTDRGSATGGRAASAGGPSPDPSPLVPRGEGGTSGAEGRVVARRLPVSDASWRGRPGLVRGSDAAEGHRNFFGEARQPPESLRSRRPATPVARSGEPSACDETSGRGAGSGRGVVEVLQGGRVRDARPQGREHGAPSTEPEGRERPWRAGGSPPLGTVVSCPTARAARPGAQRRDTPEPAVRAARLTTG
jgi:hypothetical protein